MPASVTHLFAAIPVVDRDAAIAWYERFTGAAPDLLPNDAEACWLIRNGAWLLVVVAADRAGSASHTLLVDDLDGFLAGLAERGIAYEPVTTIADGVRRTSVTDPDGNRLQIGQPPG